MPYLTNDEAIEAINRIMWLFEKNHKKDQDSLKNTNHYSELCELGAIEAIKPGRIVELEIKGQRYFGIILSCNTIVYITEKGEIKGYLNNYTIDHPYKINKILCPTSKYFQLKDFDKMLVMWERPIKPTTIKKSISEIEKELGLEPGTLEIY